MIQAVYPGSFDPLHNGHFDVIERSSRIFAQLIVAVAHNPLKNSKLFTAEERCSMIREAVAHLGNVQVETFEGLLVNYVVQKQFQVVIKGLRTVADFEYEMQMAHMNHHVNPSVETAFFLTDPRWSFVSSSRVKEVASFGADASGLVPAASLKHLQAKFGTEGAKS